MSDSDSGYSVNIRKADTPANVPLTIYDELCRDYRLHSRIVRASEARGNASYPLPFDAAKKPDWLPDLLEELADAMVYCRAQLKRLATLTRTDAKARHASLTISNIERRLSRDIADLCDLDTEWSKDGVD